MATIYQQWNQSTLQIDAKCDERKIYMHFVVLYIDCLSMKMGLTNTDRTAKFIA